MNGYCDSFTLCYMMALRGNGLSSLSETGPSLSLGREDADALKAKKAAADLEFVEEKRLQVIERRTGDGDPQRVAQARAHSPCARAQAICVSRAELTGATARAICAARTRVGGDR